MLRIIECIGGKYIEKWFKIWVLKGLKTDQKKSNTCEKSKGKPKKYGKRRTSSAEEFISCIQRIGSVLYQNVSYCVVLLFYWVYCNLYCSISIIVYLYLHDTVLRTKKECMIEESIIKMCEKDVRTKKCNQKVCQFGTS